MLLIVARLLRLMDRDDETNLFEFELTLQNGDVKTISVQRVSGG